MDDAFDHVVDRCHVWCIEIYQGEVSFFPISIDPEPTCTMKVRSQHSGLAATCVCAVSSCPVASLLKSSLMASTSLRFQVAF
jgi:hypothetical protein